MDDMNIPRGRISDIAEVNPKINISFNPEEVVSFISMQDTDENGEIINIQERSYQEVAKGYTKFIDGDVLVAKITPCFENGKGGFTSCLNNGFGAGSTEFHIVRAKSGKGDSKFLHHLTRSNEFRKVGEKSMKGSAGQKRLPSDFISDYKTFIPPLPEQKKIAEILSGIDEIISKINLEIKKIQNLKKAVIKKLFKEGINHRNYQNNISKDKITSWNIFRLGQICEFTQGVQIPLDQTIRQKRTGFIRYLYISDFLSDKKKLFVENKFPKKIISSNDLVMANTGHTAGTIFHGKEGVLSNNAFKISVPSIVNPDYLYYYLSTDEYWLEVRRLFNTAGQPHVGHGNIANIKFLCPSLEEQEKVVSIIKSMELNLKNKNQKVLSLISLKKSVMQDLLSGRKRVTV